MQIVTRNKFNAYKDEKQKKYNTHDKDGTFNVDESLATQEVDSIRQTDEFLSRINLVTVPQLTGESIGLGSGKLIAARVDTLRGGTRKPRKIKPEASMNYECQQVNFDSAISFETMDAYAHQEDFYECLEREIRKHSNLDLIRVGFFGKEAADNSDAAQYPNGEDVSKGWIQALRDNREASILGSPDQDIQIGEGGQYASVNEAVCAVKDKIAARHRDVNDLIVLLGSDLVAYDRASFYQKQIDPKQPVHQIELRQIKESYGAMPAFMPSCFPARGIMVTSFDNLSIYFLEYAFRRSFGKRNDSLNVLENLESASLAYIIEQLDKAAAIEFESVKLKKGDAWQ
ncbi:P2 family phage major capsid protein [Vibrio coralliilyticus]|uniref:P2 family phage major capsid protein n=1 Tax=Vibrio coralliilyticus TaxID=190893 RepID=UPI00148B44BA|nr:P2 family phage major capsid protein [Vibrio coralliilyticus]NOI31888.1 P2 family phage major capsid protein [Vibrio coralliilyticus]NOI51230.1 P2 family phage major capsid protein [Vibrio coralliilyticus]